MEQGLQSDMQARSRMSMGPREAQARTSGPRVAQAGSTGPRVVLAWSTRPRVAQAGSTGPRVAREEERAEASRPCVVQATAQGGAPRVE
jgi:hypothetical protein